MSKAALADLNRRLTGDSKEFRNKTINTELHAVDTKATSIKAELRKEIQATDPDLLNYISDTDLGRAAQKFRSVLMAIASNGRFTGLNILESNPTVIVSNTYGTLSTALAKASDAAIQYINGVLNRNKADYAPLLSKKLIHLDHTRTVAETRITSDINAAGIDPLSLVRELKSRKFIGKKDLKTVYENILDINSYYRGNNKTFEIRGAVVEGQLRSGTENEKEGRKDVNARSAAFKKAVLQAIEDVNWPEQAASDSFKEFALKEINNAAKKAGGTGKLKKVDKSSAKVQTKTKVATKRSVSLYQGVDRIAPRPKKSMISLASINAYINSRLPAVIRSHMNGGALHNRTGRFSESAKVVEAQVTPQGYPSLGYTYQRSPYDVFDPVLGKAPWNTPGRDPKKLVEKSIREIAQDMAIGRFYLRRV